nr:murein L,D-transpeptidase [Actinomycetota bacterium]
TLLRAGRPVTTVRTRPDGSFRFVTRLGEPGPYRARSLNVFSEPRAVVIRPGLEAVLDGSPTVGSPLRLVARVLPARAGALRVTVLRDGERTYRATYRGAVRLRLGTGRPGRLRIRLSLEPARRFVPASRVLSTAVVEPRLALGSSGPSVAALEERLAELHYALRGIDGAFGLDTYEAILAFQKVHGLARTGRVDGSLWRALAGSAVPTARYGGDHIEVSKGRQVLYVVRGGQVTAVVHVSTGATGNTPLGRWRIYRKSVGWDWVLWYPMYFLRGFAIHGYPSVPAYPASHGCVRVPMWIAPRLFADNPYGGAVYVYS